MYIIHENTLVKWYLFSGIMFSFITHFALVITIWSLNVDSLVLESTLLDINTDLEAKRFVYILTTIHFILATLPILLEANPDNYGYSELYLRKRVFWLNTLCIVFIIWAILFLKEREHSALFFIALAAVVAFCTMIYHVNESKVVFIFKVLLVALYVYTFSITLKVVTIN